MWRGHRGCGRPPSRSSSRWPSAPTSSRSCRNTTGMCPRPRAHWICRAAISTRKSSATDSLGRRSGGHREGPRLGQGDGRSGPAPQEAAGGRPHARPSERRPTDRPKAGRYTRGRLERRGGAAHRPRAHRDLGESGARRARGHRDRPGRLALFARLRSAAGLLPRRRDHGDRRGIVGEHFVLEATPRLRARGRADPHRLGDSPHDAGSVAARRRQGRNPVAVPRRAAAALTPVTRHLKPPMPENFKNFIAGEWVAPRTGAYFENRNPADWDDVIGCFPRSGAEDVARAIVSAKRGFAQWSKTPAPIRGEVLHRVGDLLVQRKEAIARAMTREMGKVLAETRGDVQEGIDTAHYAHTEGRRLFGRTVPSELRNKWAMSFRRPIGVAGLITPFNFPLAIPTWKMFPALLCGNAVIFKPAEDVPHTAHLLVEILLEAGLPPEVVQLVHGEGSVVGKAMVEHPEVPVVSFTGSTETGSVIGATCGRMHKRLSLEMGGKNAMIVMDDADLDLALDGVLWGAFGTTGQRCTATSRLVVLERVHDKLVKMLCDRAERLRLGPGLDAKTDVGPLINEDARKKVEYYVGVGRDEGAQVLIGGERATGKGLERGWFYKPTVLAGVRAGMRVEQEEIFGPVLSVIKVGSLDEAVGVNNDVKYGLSSSLYTRDVNAAFQAMGELDTGITYVNAPTIGAEAHLPFGGVKQTGNGHREGGWEVYDFYSETKVVYVDFSGKLQRAQIDTEI